MDTDTSTPNRPTAFQTISQVVGAVVLGAVGWWVWMVVGVLGSFAAVSGLLWLTGATGLPDWVLFALIFGVPMVWLKVVDDRKKAREKAPTLTTD